MLFPQSTRDETAISVRTCRFGKQARRRSTIYTSHMHSHVHTSQVPGIIAIRLQRSRDRKVSSNLQAFKYTKKLWRRAWCCPIKRMAFGAKCKIHKRTPFVARLSAHLPRRVCCTHCHTCYSTIPWLCFQSCWDPFLWRLAKFQRRRRSLPVCVVPNAR